MKAVSTPRFREHLGTIWATLLVGLAAMGLLAAALAVHSTGGHHDHGAEASVAVEAHGHAAETSAAETVLSADCADCLAACALAALGCALALVLVVRAALRRPTTVISRIHRAVLFLASKAPPIPLPAGPSLLTLCIARI